VLAESRRDLDLRGEATRDALAFLEARGIELPRGLAIRFGQNPRAFLPGPDWEFFSIRLFDCRIHWAWVTDPITGERKLSSERLLGLRDRPASPPRRSRRWTDPLKPRTGGVRPGKSPRQLGRSPSLRPLRGKPNGSCSGPRSQDRIHAPSSSPACTWKLPATTNGGDSPTTPRVKADHLARALAPNHEHGCTEVERQALAPGTRWRPRRSGGRRERSASSARRGRGAKGRVQRLRNREAPNIVTEVRTGKSYPGHHDQCDSVWHEIGGGAGLDCRDTFGAVSPTAPSTIMRADAPWSGLSKARCSFSTEAGAARGPKHAGRDHAARAFAAADGSERESILSGHARRSSAAGASAVRRNRP
jgi:hypothetical protein